LPKLDVDPHKDSFDTVKTYCRRDVEITVAAILKYMDFAREHDAGRFSLTKASQSFAAYRHRFMHAKIYIHKEEEAVDLERSAYFGGRTECFQIGDVKGGPFVFLDVNSMYPWVMKTRRYPNRLLGIEREPSDKFVDSFLSTTAVVVDATIHTETPRFAIRYNDKTVFPVGIFRASLCTEGFTRLWNEGGILKIHKIAVYEWDDLFSEYIDYWYPLKAEYKRSGNAIYAMLVKKYLNSLYGKFGQKAAILDVFDAEGEGGIYRMENMSLETGERWVEYRLFNKIVCEKGFRNGDRSLVAIPAHVTEYARLALWDIIEGIGFHRVHYCDTDSVAICKSDIDKVAHPVDKETLGALSVDKETESLTIYGPKDYRMGEKRVLKGIPKSATQTGPNSWTYDQFAGMASHMRAAITSGYIIRKVTKTVNPTYDKGIVTASGRVEPFRLS